MDSTRDTILASLRQTPQTIRALAQALGLTRNAVVVQINQLLADGLIRKGTVAPVKSAGKPAHTYEAVPGHEDSLSHAYQPFSELLVSVLSEGLSPEALDSLMRRVGKDMARSLTQAGPLDTRLKAALSFADALGAATTLIPLEDGYLIESHNCPVASLVRKDACVCSAISQFFESATDRPVTSLCDRACKLTCRFKVNLEPARQNEEVLKT